MSKHACARRLIIFTGKCSRPAPCVWLLAGHWCSTLRCGWTWCDVGQELLREVGTASEGIAGAVGHAAASIVCHCALLNWRTC